jgi:hypothetical protein
MAKIHQPKPAQHLRQTIGHPPHLRHQPFGLAA